MAERLKNLLLAVLLVFMAVLLVLTFFFGIQGSHGGQRLLQSLEDSDDFTVSGTIRPAAQPEKLALMGENGLFLAQEGTDYSLLYQQAEPLWQEALGSANELEHMTETDYLQALQAPAVLLQYHTAQPLYLLRAWSGSEALQEELAVTGVALAGREDRVILMITDRSGSRWQAETAASYAELEALCADVPQGNSVLAGPHAVLAGDEVLTCQAGSFDALSIAAPELVLRGELSESIQSMFGMNAYLTKVYLNADGSLVYVESHSTISLSPEGDLSYAGEGIQLELTASGGNARRAEICQQVYERLAHLWEQAGASGQLSLEELQVEGDRYVLRFGLHLDGRFLERTEGFWATVTVEDNVITGLTAALRQVEETESLQLLPLYQAAATLERGKGSLRVRLLEQTDGTLLPRICFVTEE